MPSSKSDLNKLIYHIANEISDIVSRPNKITITDKSDTCNAYFDVKGPDWQFILRFGMRPDGQSLELLADSGAGAESLPERVKDRYQKVIEYAKDSKNMDLNARFGRKYSAFIKELEDNLNSIIGVGVELHNNKFIMKDDGVSVANVYVQHNNQVRIYVRDINHLALIRYVADKYAEEFKVVCSQASVATRNWQARAIKGVPSM